MDWLEGEFQFTHPRGVRHAFMDWLEGEIAISIHTPTWGATSVWLYLDAVQCISIHTPTWGATRQQHIGIKSQTSFQFTHPRGVRLLVPCGIVAVLSYFNSHTHVGCDSKN